MKLLTRRQLLKQTLSFTKIRLLYARITLTRYTTAYFFLAACTFLVLAALQALTSTDNAAAIRILSPFLPAAKADAGLVVLRNGVLSLCTNIPDQPGTVCTQMLVFGDLDIDDFVLRTTGYGDADEDADEHGNLRATNASGPITLAPSVTPSVTASDTTAAAAAASLPNTCVLSLRWLDETLHDARREDVVTFLFDIWLFLLALATILNESIPHLLAALLGHLLGAGWAAYRLASTEALKDFYQAHIVPEACGDMDPMDGWWDVRIGHSIPIVAVNGVTLLAFGYLSVMLFKVYATASFSRVGASPKIHRVYKIVLVFSAFLQLATFFTLATSGMWIDKVFHGAMQFLALHSKLYLAAFIIELVLQIPWIFLGWVCVRKECRVGFGVFCALSLFFVVVPTLMFSSPLYRYIVATWPFFATVKITAYVLTIVTVVLAGVCRLNFGKGLKHFLQVTDALEGVDFTPVFFPNLRDEKDAEEFMAELDSNNKRAALNSSAVEANEPANSDESGLPTLAVMSPMSFRKSSSIYAHGHSSSLTLVPELGEASAVSSVAGAASVRAPPRVLMRKASAPSARGRGRAESSASEASTGSQSSVGSMSSLQSLLGSSAGENGPRRMANGPANPRVGMNSQS